MMTRLELIKKADRDVQKAMNMRTMICSIADTIEGAQSFGATWGTLHVRCNGYENKDRIVQTIGIRMIPLIGFWSSTGDHCFPYSAPDYKGAGVIISVSGVEREGESE